MSTFLSETSKPKLIESKIIKRMITQQNDCINTNIQNELIKHIRKYTI